MRRPPVLALLPLLACAVLVGCDLKGDVEVVAEFDDTFSFETDLQGWTPRALVAGAPPAAWEIARAADEPTDGAQAVRFRLENGNDPSRIWIERRYEVAPDQEYEVRLTFDLVSADHVASGPWRVLAGGSAERPSVAADLVASADTGNGAAGGAGFVTVEKAVVMPVTSDEDGELFVYVGIEGASAAARTYHVDRVRVELWRRGLSAPTGPTAVL